MIAVYAADTTVYDVNRQLLNFREVFESNGSNFHSGGLRWDTGKKWRKSQNFNIFFVKNENIMYGEHFVKFLAPN